MRIEPTGSTPSPSEQNGWSTLENFTKQLGTFVNNPYEANAVEFASTILQLHKEAKSL